MKNEEFKPQLVGTDQTTIEKKNKNWKEVISEISFIASSWSEVFGEAMQPHHLQKMIGLKEITRYLQEHFVNLSETEIARGVKTGQYEMKAALHNIKFPDFENLKNSIISLNVWLKQNGFSDELLAHMDEIYNGSAFVFTDFFKIKIEADNTFYTRSEHENKALKLVNDVCMSLNRLNEIGIPVSSADLPLSVRNCFATVPGEKTYEELQSGAGNPAWKMPKLVPYWGMFRQENNAALQQIKLNA